MRGLTAMFLLALPMLCGACALPVFKAGPTAPPRIAFESAPAQLYDDPVWHGATDPSVIWNAARGEWLMYYTQRRSTLPNPAGVNWVHGTAIGIAASKNGLDWKYLGICEGDENLGKPLSAKGNGPEPGITWWAPCVVETGGAFHMFVTRVDGVYSKWVGRRDIVHFTSADGMHWKFVNVCALHSQRVIDAMVYKIGDAWQMVYKDEAAGSHTYRSESKDLIDWTSGVLTDRDGSQEAPFVFRSQNAYWMIVDNGRGLRVYKSPDGLDRWEFNVALLTAPDLRPGDWSVGRHPCIVMQSAPDGAEQCLMYYFTEKDKRSAIHLAELKLGATGKMICVRHTHATEMLSR